MVKIDEFSSSNIIVIDTNKNGEVDAEDTALASASFCGKSIGDRVEFDHPLYAAEREFSERRVASDPLVAEANLEIERKIEIIYEVDIRDHASGNPSYKEVCWRTNGQAKCDSIRVQGGRYFTPHELACSVHELLQNDNDVMTSQHGRPRERLLKSDRCGGIKRSAEPKVVRSSETYEKMLRKGFYIKGDEIFTSQHEMVIRMSAQEGTTDIVALTLKDESILRICIVNDHGRTEYKYLDLNSGKEIQHDYDYGVCLSRVPVPKKTDHYIINVLIEGGHILVNDSNGNGQIDEGDLAVLAAHYVDGVEVKRGSVLSFDDPIYVAARQKVEEHKRAEEEKARAESERISKLNDVAERYGVKIRVPERHEYRCRCEVFNVYKDGVLQGTIVSSNTQPGLESFTPAELSIELSVLLSVEPIDIH